MNYDPNNVIRVGTDLRFVDASKPWDKVRTFSCSIADDWSLTTVAMGQGL
jgi:hypothetical protein